MAAKTKTNCAECESATAAESDTWATMPPLFIWLAEHGGEYGAILLIDAALIARFNGATGFESKLRTQGFTNIRRVRTAEECEAALAAESGKKVGSWSGIWRAQYAWETAEDA
jgi:hypothetical protein